MIFDIIFFVIDLVLSVFTKILPSFSVWPDSVLNSIEFMVNSLSIVNFILPIDVLFSAIVFFVYFETIYYSARIATSIINYVRGTGKGIEI